MKPIPFGLTLILIASLLAGCAAIGSALGGGTPTPPPTASAPATATPTLAPTVVPSPTPLVVGGTLSIRHSWSEKELPALAQIIDGFRLKYPEVYFDVLSVPAQDLRAYYENDAQTGNPASLLFGPAEWGPGLYQAGLIADLGDLLSAEQMATLNAPAVQAGRWQNAQVGLPYSLQGVVLFRNKDVVTINPANWKELLALSETTTQGETIGAILERAPLYSLAHLHGLGGQVMDENGNPAFNSPAGLAWIDLLRGFEQAGPPNYLTDDDLSRFQEGKVGWIIDGTWNLRNLAAGVGPENLAIDPWPASDQGRLAGYVIPENIYLSAQASPAQRLAAQKFLEYFLSPEAQSVLAEAGRIPAAAGAAPADPALARLTKEAAAALAQGIPYPTTPNMALYSLNLDIALRAIFEQQVAPEQALQAAEEAIRAGLAVEATATP